MIEHDPSPEDWARLRRYASWIRRLSLGLGRSDIHEIFLRRSRGSAGRVLFSGLELLYCYLGQTGFSSSYFHLFLPPRLKTITLHAHRHTKESGGGSHPYYLVFDRFSPISDREVWPGERATPRGYNNLLRSPTRVVTQTFHLRLTFIRGSNAASKLTLLGYHP